MAVACLKTADVRDAHTVLNLNRALPGFYVSPCKKRGRKDSMLLCLRQDRRADPYQGMKDSPTVSPLFGVLSESTDVKGTRASAERQLNRLGIAGDHIP